MGKHTFEIRQAQAGEVYGHEDGRLGHFGIFIDGHDTEYSNDPMQAFPTCMQQAMAEGLAPGGEAEKRALELCEERSRHCLERIVNHIKDGSLIPGGVPLGAKGLDLSPAKKPARRDETAAVTAFLNRGSLNGLDADDRHKRRQKRHETHDHEAAWRDRRNQLIAAKEKELADVQADAAANPEKAPKLMRTMALLRDELRGLKPAVLAASHGFQYAYYKYLTKAVDLVNDDIRIVPCMTNTSADTQRDSMTSVSAITTLDEFDGSGYSTGGQALDTQAVNVDDANDRAEFDADDEAATLGAGTRSIQGNLLISFITNLNSSLPLHWIEYAANKTPDGSTFTVVFNAEGILQAADG